MLQSTLIINYLSKSNMIIFSYVFLLFWDDRMYCNHFIDWSLCHCGVIWKLKKLQNFGIKWSGWTRFIDMIMKNILYSSGYLELPWWRKQNHTVSSCKNCHWFLYFFISSPLCISSIFFVLYQKRGQKVLYIAWPFSS